MEGKIQNVKFCKVISIDDDTDADRIKVRLAPEDNSKTLSEIEYAFPLLPKMFHVKPKVGEAVLVLLAINNDGNSQRYYIGPVISQDHRIYNDPFLMGGDSFLRGAYKKFDPAPRMDPDTNGVLPNDDDIVIRGRKNADIQITEDDIRIKAGVKLVDNYNTYNLYKKSVEKETFNYMYNEVIVYVVGGGCLGEFEYIDELLKKSGKNVMYGCDYLYRPNEFVDDLEQLSNIMESK